MPLVESFSGVRGIYDDGLDEQVAIRYAYSYLQFLRKKAGKNKIKIVIGSDTRPSRKIIKDALIEAFDCDVIDLGIASTPMTEFCVRHYKADGGVIITASHNEPYWNGFKFLDNNGAVLKAEDMDKVIELYSQIKKLGNEKFFSSCLYKNTGPEEFKARKVSRKYDESNEKYSEYVLGFLSGKDKQEIKNAKIKVIIDPNGGTGTIAKPILEKLGVKVHGVNMKHGIFNRKVEPNEDSLFYLTNMVRDKKYDLAAGFDCDADRVEIVTDKGIVSGNELLALIADEILKNAKNRAIVVNNATSLAVRDIAKKHNAKYIETEVGETNVVNEMYRLNAAIGGEGSSSGVIIPDSRCRDGILTLVYVLKILALRKQNLEGLINALPSYHNVKEKITIDPKKYNSLMEKALNYYKKKNYKVIKTGTSVKIMPDENSFIWFRASKTEANLFRVIADARDRKTVQSLIDEALSLVKHGKQ